ncbi:MAG: hypothetical protein KDB46_08110 [Solirubrobacterales bacterium]|nr:hypothetical protein [Solirubrobacterales bacterium]
MDVKHLNPLRNLPTNADMGQLHETFLVSAVAMILVIRTQLWLTNYPQLGGSGLHIAHLLWGGLFMVITIGILLTLLGRGARVPAAVLGGIGFGFFIDELGKFITEDNDYFFKPAAGVIYICFVALFLVSRHLQRSRRLSEADLLRNAMERLGGATHGNFDARDRARTLEFLDGVDATNPMVVPLRELVHRIEAAPAPARSRWSLLAERVRRRYMEVAAKRWFVRAIVGFFAVWAAVTILNLATVIGALASSDVESALLEENGTFLGTAIGVSSGVAAVFVVIGLLRIRRGAREEGYEWIARGLLVSLFITQVFLFVQSQFGAVFGLGLDVVLLITVRTLARNERERRAEQPPAAEPAAAPA